MHLFPVILAKVKREFTINLFFPTNYLLGLSLLSHYPHGVYALCITPPDWDSISSSKSAQSNKYYEPILPTTFFIQEETRNEFLSNNWSWAKCCPLCLNLTRSCYKHCKKVTGIEASQTLLFTGASRSQTCQDSITSQISDHRKKVGRNCERLFCLSSSRILLGTSALLPQMKHILQIPEGISTSSAGRDYMQKPKCPGLHICCTMHNGHILLSLHCNKIRWLTNLGMRLSSLY